VLKGFVYACDLLLQFAHGTLTSCGVLNLFGGRHRVANMGNLPLLPFLVARVSFTNQQKIKRVMRRMTLMWSWPSASLGASFGN
jgi:hypothetical protein